MPENPLGVVGRASERAMDELARARDVRFGRGQSLIAGLLIGWGGIALKAGLNAYIGGDTGYIVLMASAVIAAWYGGLIGGVSSTIVAAVLNAVFFFDLSAPNSQSAHVEQFREVLYLLVGTGIATLIGSRRVARDRLEDALADAATLADKVVARDTRLEMMLGASGMGFWEWDVLTNELTWSDSIFRQYGLEPATNAPAYATYLDMIHPDDRAMFQTAIAATVDEVVPFALDFRIIWPDGTVHWTRGAGRLFLDDDGRPLRMLGTGQDITARRRVEDDRDRLLTEDRRAGEFREAFIDIISHELRTPVTTILGLTEILARPGRTDDHARMDLLEDVRAESERLHRLVEDLVVLSRVERGALVVDPEPLEPRRLLERIVAGEAPEVPTISVETDLDPDLPIVAGEATYVEQIVRNLLGNAAKYTPAGSHVLVSARQHDGAVEVRISDDGPGIPQASLDRIFGLFYRDPDSARMVAGSGIGLFVCASLVEAMGGRIWALRRPEGGSEFGFTLRVLEADSADLEPVEGSGGGGTVELAISETSPPGG